MDPAPTSSGKATASSSTGTPVAAAAAGIPTEFPAGLRVLLVDDDATCLKIIDMMLRKCHYDGTICLRICRLPLKPFPSLSPALFLCIPYCALPLLLHLTETLTTCSCAATALSMLRKRKGWFDLVLSDVYMPDMDGFKLLERIGLEMDLPVISKCTAT
ncbi:hypothetical protein BHE74_00048319 [Ensete ventricosum]|nr:hypothetical protein BHE74_00048319 [Ensete ventricosum]